ncbi:uncharacterized protein CBL_09961 [Carabus blaptoides fortunei]
MSLPMLDYNAANQIGYSCLQLHLNKETRASSGKSYLNPIPNRKNLHVQADTFVDKVLIDATTKRAYGIEYRDKKNIYKIRASKEVIISTGAIKGKTEDWKQILDTNVLGLCICTREAAKSMKENNIDGHVVHINGIFGHWVSDFPKLSVYGASKFAVTALTDTLRKEFNLKGSKIKVTSVSPGAVQTEVMTNIEDFDAELIKNIPMLESEDVADAILYVIGTAPHILIQELIIRPVGEKL